MWGGVITVLGVISTVFYSGYTFSKHQADIVAFKAGCEQKAKNKSFDLKNSQDTIRSLKQKFEEVRFTLKRREENITSLKLELAEYEESIKKNKIPISMQNNCKQLEIYISKKEKTIKGIKMKLKDITILNVLSQDREKMTKTELNTELNSLQKQQEDASKKFIECLSSDS